MGPRGTYWQSRCEHSKHHKCMQKTRCTQVHGTAIPCACITNNMAIYVKGIKDGLPHNPAIARINGSKSNVHHGVGMRARIGMDTVRLTRSKTPNPKLASPKLNPKP